MNKRNFFWVIFLNSFLFFFQTPGKAKLIDSLVAKKVTIGFLHEHNKVCKIVSMLKLDNLSYNKDTSLLYIFGLDNKGFVIVSGSDNTVPILGYCLESGFDPLYIPENIKTWLGIYKKEIKYCIDQKFKPNLKISDQWNVLLNYDDDNNIFYSKKTIVKPLISTSWNQVPFYNDFCPIDIVSGTRAITGCVATVLAQIMKYWQWPKIGIGSYGYIDSVFGSQYANFGTTKYNWNSMPNSINSPNSAIAQVMYQAGVAVQMHYGITSSDAYVLSARCPIKNNAQYALINYFNFSNAMQAAYRSNYIDADWINLIEQEILQGRPLIYDGSNDSLGHSFIADGFDENNFIHFNWGWGGSFNGYFNIDNIAPDNINLMQNNEILMGLVPDSSKVLVMADSIELNEKSFQWNPFTVSAKIKNVTETTFKGDCIAILSSDYYDVLPLNDTIKNIYLNFGDSITLNFSYPGILAGAYHLQITFLRENSTQQQNVSNSSNYSSLVPIVIYGNPSLNQCSLFPNPATNSVFINLNNSVANSFKLTDVFGKTWLESNLDTSISIIPISISNLPEGLYFVTINTSFGKQCLKFSKLN